MAALYILTQDSKWGASHNILVEVFDVKDEINDVFPIFKEINRAEPVSLIDLIHSDSDAEELGESEDEDNKEAVQELASDSTNIMTPPITREDPATVVNSENTDDKTVSPPLTSTKVSQKKTNSISMKQIKSIIDGTCSHFKTKHPAMFKPSKNCRPPHANIDNLREQMFESRHQLFESNGENMPMIRSMEELVCHVSDINDRLGQRTSKEWHEVRDGLTTKTRTTALKKAEYHQFYLGMDKTWLY